MTGFLGEIRFIFVRIIVRMKTPDPLKPGDKIGIVAPARWIPQDKYAEILAIIEAEGYQPVRGKTTFLEHGIFAGTDVQRLLIYRRCSITLKLKQFFVCEAVTAPFVSSTGLILQNFSQTQNG
jgi:hypothetical protein